jgi:hypothetical protein
MPNIKRANALGITKPGTAIADVPDAPTIGTATGGSGAATVTYTAAATGGTATTFTATSSPGSLTGTGASPITVSGLTNGTAYTFTVTASNSTGTSAASSASNSVTPVSLGDMDPIAMVEVGSAGSSQIEFASIPSTYTHLQIRIMAKLTDSSGVGGYAGVRFNSDASSSNYTFHRLKGDGSDATAYGSGTGTFDWIVNERITSSHSNFATEEHGVLIIDILEYKNTSKYKTVRSLGGYDSNGTGEILLTSGLWLNTTAISNIKILPSTTNFSQYSSFALYGLKGA